MNDFRPRSNKVAEMPRGSQDTARSFSGARPFLFLFVSVLAVLAACRTTSARAPLRNVEGTPKILVLRGLMEVFSLGMNDLAKKLECRGYDVELTSWSMALFHAKCSDSRPIVVIGHSLGGRMCAWVSRKMQECGVTVPLIIIVDANVVQSIPRNVERCVHLYVTNELGVFHGHPVRPESLTTDVVNWDVSQGQPPWYRGGINHFDIDATPWIHDIIIGEVERRFPLTYQRARARPRRTRGSLALAGYEAAISGNASQRRQQRLQPNRRTANRPVLRGQGFNLPRGVDGKSFSVGTLGGP